MQYIEQFKICIEKIYSLNKQCLDKICNNAELKEIPKNEFFSVKGTYPKELGFINNGILRIYYDNEEGEEWNKHFVKENDFIAASINNSEKSTTNIQALTPVIYLSVPIKILLEIGEEYQQVDLFMQKLKHIVWEKEQKKELLLLSKRTKDRYDIFKKEFPGLEDKIPHYYIASYLGITPTQLSRIRQKD